MDRGIANSRLAAVTVWRNLLLAGLGLSLAVNVMLAAFVMGKHQSVVLLPSVRAGGTYELGAAGVSRAYLEDMARTVTHTMLNITPGVDDYVLDSLLSLTHPSFYGSFRGQFEDWVAEVRDRNLSTAFYPLSLRSDPAALSVTVTGVLRSYIGEKQVDEERVIYRLSFDYTGTRLTLASLQEQREDA